MVLCINQVYPYYYGVLLKRMNVKQTIIIIWTSINFIDYIPLAIFWNNVNEDTKKKLFFLGKMKDFFHQTKRASC